MGRLNKRKQQLKRLAEARQVVRRMSLDTRRRRR
jgi:hypothetical protein